MLMQAYFDGEGQCTHARRLSASASASLAATSSRASSGTSDCAESAAAAAAAAAALEGSHERRFRMAPARPPPALEDRGQIFVQVRCHVDWSQG